MDTPVVITGPGPPSRSPNVVHEPARVEPTYKLEPARLLGERGPQGSSFGDRLVNWPEPEVNDTKNRLSLHQV
jgi:hypothetical protein